MHRDNVCMILNMKIAGGELDCMAGQRHVLPETGSHGQRHGLGVAYTG